MRSFLVTLLMVFSLGLCGLVAFQWTREVRLRQRLQELVNQVQDQKAVSYTHLTLPTTPYV